MQDSRPKFVEMLTDATSQSAPAAATNAGTPHSECCTDRYTRYPTRARLRLEPGDFDYLAHQGTLTVERRGDRQYCKLRFRRSGRQIVRYVGPVDAATIVQQELDQLQSMHRTLRELTVLDRCARRFLRTEKLRLEPILAVEGFRLHGRAYRKPRHAN